MHARRRIRIDGGSDASFSYIHLSSSSVIVHAPRNARPESGWVVDLDLVVDLESWTVDDGDLGNAPGVGDLGGGMLAAGLGDRP